MKSYFEIFQWNQMLFGFHGMDKDLFQFSFLGEISL